MSKLITDPNMFMDYLEKAYIKKDREASEMVKAGVQAFALEPIKKFKKQIQAFGVSTDMAILTKDAFNITVEEDNFDMGWEQAFRSVPLGKGQDAWEIYNVENGITFYKVEEGERIDMNKLSGDKVTAYVDYYGGALGWTDKMIRFRKVPMMVDKARAFRNKFFANKADNFYLLLAAAGLLNVIAYQGVAADGQLQRDIQTINEGAFQIGDVNKDKGFGDMANAPLLMYANPQDENRIEAAFRVTSNALATAGQTGVQVTSRRIRRIYTYNSNITAGSPLLVLPGNKLQKADAMMPTTYTAPIDPLTLNQYQAVWAIYGGAVGDTDQVYQLTLE